MKKAFYSLFNWQHYSAKNRERRNEMQDGYAQTGARSRLGAGARSLPSLHKGTTPNASARLVSGIPSSTAYNDTISSKSKAIPVPNSNYSRVKKPQALNTPPKKTSFSIDTKSPTDDFVAIETNLADRESKTSSFGFTKPTRKISKQTSVNLINENEQIQSITEIKSTPNLKLIDSTVSKTTKPPETVIPVRKTSRISLLPFVRKGPVEDREQKTKSGGFLRSFRGGSPSPDVKTSGNFFKSTPNLIVVKNINNNDVLSENDVGIKQKKNWQVVKRNVLIAKTTSTPVKGHHNSPQTPTKGQDGGPPLKGATSVSSLDSKHHKVAPTQRDKPSKVFGSKDKLHKDKAKKREERAVQNDDSINEDAAEMDTVEFRRPDVASLRGSRNNNKVEYSSADELSSSGPRGAVFELSVPCVRIPSVSIPSSLPVSNTEQACASLPPMLVGIPPSLQEINGPIDIQPEPEPAARLAGVQQTSEELEEVRRKLEGVEKQREELERKVAALMAQTKDMADLRKELADVKAAGERASAENVSLRARLRGVAHSPLSDNEKRQLLQDAGHSSAPCSMPTDSDGEAMTPEWDKHSSSSLSEVSVACLQDRILQMEENHHSTNEELQATLQELSDLQNQLSEVQVENERLSDEKSVLLESLCRQTEKLEDSRTKVDTLQELLLREGGEQEACSTEREQKLVLILKSGQDEREVLLIKQEELKSENLELRETLESTVKENERLHERVMSMECTMETNSQELKQMHQELVGARDLAGARQTQLQHVSELLDTANAKISMFESSNSGAASGQQAVALQRQTELLQEQLAGARRQQDRLAHVCSQLQEENALTKNNAISAVADLETQCNQLKQDKSTLLTEVQSLQEANSDLQLQCQCLTEERRSSQSALTEAQRATTAAEQRNRETQARLTIEISERERDAVEWKQFQSDLLMTVRVANDFKTEAQRELEKLVLENKVHRERVRSLESQIDQLKAGSVLSQVPLSPNLRSPSSEEIATPPQPPPTPPILPPSPTPSPLPLLTSASIQDMMSSQTAQRRNNKGGVSRQDSRLSVKSLIESIENAAKQAKASGGGSLTSSTSSLSSLVAAENLEAQQNAQNLKSPLGDQPPSPSPNSGPTSNGGLNHNSMPGTPTANAYNGASPLSKPPASARSPRGMIITNDQSKGDYNGGMMLSPGLKMSSLAAASKIQTTANLTDDQTSSVHSLMQHNKAMETFVRRNSYGDLSERKDPLNSLVKNGGSKRNALLKWCQNKTVGYRNIDITNFSSSWNDGLALCALLHTYLPSRVPYDSLPTSDKKHNFSTAFAAAESVGIPTTLNIQDMIQLERPDWQQVMAYVTAIYKHFET